MVLTKLVDFIKEIKQKWNITKEEADSMAGIEFNQGSVHFVYSEKELQKQKEIEEKLQKLWNEYVDENGYERTSRLVTKNPGSTSN